MMLCLLLWCPCNDTLYTTYPFYVAMRNCYTQVLCKPCTRLELLSCIAAHAPAGLGVELVQVEVPAE